MTPHVLLVEDSPTDVLMVRAAFEQVGARLHLHVVEDGVEAMAFLSREGAFAEAPRPQLVLLDLNLPRKTGWEVLEEVRADPDLTHLPVVVLTTSRSDDDVQKAYRRHASCFVTKPVDFRSFATVVGAIHHFWLRTVTLPAVNA